ncbi:MAG TPA: ATP-binding protein [Thermoanaerobaculia bacterium]|jgi:signal transduction histidine kinase/CheY-like chemotaxis protein
MPRSLLTRYAFAVAATALALVIRIAVEPLVGEGQVPYFTFFAILVAVGWYAGLGPALLAAALGGVSAVYFILPPHFSLVIYDRHVAAGLVIYALTALGSALLGNGMRHAQLRAERQARLAIERQQELEHEADERQRVEAALADRERYLSEAESRLALLTRIGELSRTIEEPQELLFAVAELVGEHFRVRRCLFNEIDLENDLETVYRDYCRGAPSVAGVHPISAYSPITSAEMAAGRVVVNFDSKTDPRTAGDYERSYGPNGERAYVAVPLMRDRRWVASLWVSTDEPRYWSDQEVSLLQTVASRVWPVVEKLRVDAALRESEESLRVSMNALREADRMKDEFLATLSHELRTPLTAIVGWSQMLEMLDLSEKDRELALETIGKSARAQLQLIEDVLDVSRITTGKMRLDRQQADLSVIIENALATVRPAAEAKQIPIEVKLDRSLAFQYVDPARVQQIVSNLLSNAIKFSPPGTPVEVTLRAEETSAAITVADRGPGIRRDLVPHIFERFRQGDSSARRAHAGLGLGLALAKELTELHGGTIDVETEEGRGSRFTVRLPMPVASIAADARRPRGNERESIDAPLERLRILYVDDRADARLLIRTMLAKSGAHVIEAGSVEEALRQLRTRKPDVVVTDIAMPGRDGYDLLDAIRLHREWDDLPVLALTAHGRIEDERRAIAAGFRSYLRKPIDMQELSAAVSRAVHAG